MTKTFCAATAAIAALIPATAALAAPATKADIVVIMDESGSMSGEQAWIPGAITQLDAGLAGAGLVDGNRFGLVGFGANTATSPAPGRVRSISVGGGQLGTAAQFGTAAGGLVINGSAEDGWAGINLASSYTFDPAAARNFILVTDEDRDNLVTSLSFTSILSSLTSTNTLLNAVVNGSFRCGDNTAALGMIGTTGYKVGASGSFSTCSGASFVSGTGTTGANYVNLAIATGGGAWNLNILRNGGNDALSFTNAFIAGKVQEIITQPPPVPEPSTIALMFAGLGVMGVVARRRQRSAPRA